MRLKCKINGKEYDIVQGATFSEEYNETLDSGSIIIDRVPKITDLRPYDDVFVYSVGQGENTFLGYRNSNQTPVSFGYTYLEDDKIIKFNAKELNDIFIAYNTILSQNITIKCALRNSSTMLLGTATFSYRDGLGMIARIVAGNVDNEYLLEEDGDYYILDYSNLFDILFFDTIDLTITLNDLQYPSFYKHLLVFQFTDERLNPKENIYKYKIELCSETMKLEKIQLPNISITQPLNINLKRSVYDYALQFVNQYNIKKKVSTTNVSNMWVYQDKYILSPDIQEIFSDVYCPDFSLDNPSLKDVLHQLFLTKDRIPYVKDDVICALDITQRHGTFNTNGAYSITGSMSAENYAHGLKRTYQDALSGFKTARRVEYLGFRNSDNALMTLGNMEIETKFPIYKINKIYMCYYKKCEIYSFEDENDQTGTKTRDMVFLCKQDITPLVKLEQERALLSEDWQDFNVANTPDGDNCIEEMARYKLCTVGYNIGDTKITGWGTQYDYPKGWWTIKKSYIENIFKIIDANIPYGIYTKGYIARNLNEGEVIMTSPSSNPIENIVSVFGDSNTSASKLKSFMFEVEYEAFYNGTTITSKDIMRDDIITNDNSSSSLTLLEKDGLFQKEKANRFGNMAYSIMANYNTIDELQELGSVYDDDVIIYSRQYQIWNNIVKASYSGTKDYVLKNYFTSVYAKHRPTALMDYSQSTNRAENRKMYVMLSKNKLYYDNPYDPLRKPPMMFQNFDGASFLDEIVSFCKPNPKVESIGKFIFNDKINFGYVEKTKLVEGVETKERYSTDINAFINGYSLCFNIAMFENLTMGNYIKEANPEINGADEVEDDFTGSVQNFYGVVDNDETGFIETMSFYVAHINEDEFNDNVVEYYNDIADDLYDKINALPKIKEEIGETNIIGGEYNICKDNKEVIDMTFQIEPITDDENIVFSEWMLKLSDLYGIYNKVSQTYQKEDVENYGLELNLRYASQSGIGRRNFPFVLIEIPKNVYDNQLQNGQNVRGGLSLPYKNHTIDMSTPNAKIKYDVAFTSFAELEQDYFTINAKTITTVYNGYNAPNSIIQEDKTFKLEKINEITELTINGLDTTNNYYFSNFSHIGTNEDGYVTVGAWKMKIDSGFPYDLSCYCDEIIAGDPISIHDFIETIMAVATGTTPQIYEKNMFLRLSDENIKKTLVYDEYPFGSLDFSNIKVDDVIVPYTKPYSSNINRDSPTYLRIYLSLILHTYYAKSIQVWFNDNGTLHFVFGVNVSDADYDRGYIDIYLSSLAKKDTRVYNENNVVVGQVKNFVNDDEEYGTTNLYEDTSN